MAGDNGEQAREQATAAAAAASVEVLRQELELRLKELEDEQKASKKRNAELAKEQKAAKELARKAAIDSEVDKYSSKVGLVCCFSFCCLGCEEGGSEEPRDPGLHW